MENMQEQMTSILQNPEMMSKIMSMAQALSGEPSEPAQQPENHTPLMPDLDFATIQKLSGFIGQSNIDKNQRTLLNALTPYLEQPRIAKLEKAMRAAKLASLASSLFSNTALFNLGR